MSEWTITETIATAHAFSLLSDRETENGKRTKQLKMLPIIQFDFKC